jgi:hypothetical protein
MHVVVQPSLTKSKTGILYFLCLVLCGYEKFNTELKFLLIVIFREEESGRFTKDTSLFLFNFMSSSLFSLLSISPTGLVFCVV